MELKLGERIKKLRIEKGVTQEELAQYIGVTYQSVSKWENDTTMPDITLLPKLAVFFGVKIDDLFSINADDELERVDHILNHEKLTDTNYDYAKRLLEAVLSENEGDVAAIIRYARLIMARNNRDSLYAGRMLERAMREDPLNDTVYGLYANIRMCSIPVFLSGCDWFIRTCEPYARQYPANISLMKKLVEITIERGYYEKAVELTEQIPCGPETNYLQALLKGDIEYAKRNIEQACRLWESVNPDDALGQYEAGERFNRAQKYEKAIACYQNSFAAQQVPKFLDAVYSLAFLYKKLGRYEEAVDAWQTIIDVSASDHGITDGETIEWALREIQSLKEDRLTRHGLPLPSPL